jgi:histidine kinase
MRRYPQRTQLRWRIVAAHMIVVAVGVVVVLVASLLLIDVIVPATVAADLAALAGAGAEEGTAALLSAFRTSVLAAVAIAAVGAILAALVTGLILAREILNPLYQLAASSGRVASGRYSERVAIPDSEELALVANSFNQMAEALERVEEQRVTLIADIAHELRTPLTALGGYLEGLLDGLFAPDEETFEAMVQELRRLQRLIDDLQSLSRVEAGQISLAMVDQPLLPLVEQAVAALQGQAENSGITLALAQPANSPVVCVDADRVVQILHNLLSNAIRYTPAGGEIAISVRERPGQAEVTVQDTGIGIPAEALPYIFERFYRVDSSRSRRSGGSGIGLTISRYLAWAMGGELTAASAGQGQGSTFTLWLPLGLASRPDAPPATRPSLA